MEERKCLNNNKSHGNPSAFDEELKFHDIQTVSHGKILVEQRERFYFRQHAKVMT